MVHVFDFGLKAGDLAAPPIVGFDGPSETLFAEFAGIAVHGFGGVALVVQSPGCDVDGARAGHQVAGWASGRVVIVEGKVPRLEALDFFGLPCRALFGQWVWMGFVFLLALKALIAAAHLVVGDQRRDAVVLEVAHIGIAVVARIGGDPCLRCAKCTGLFNHGQQHGLLGA
jgi:hypothetical protein